jgi:hypothetical protein
MFARLARRRAGSPWEASVLTRWADAKTGIEKSKNVISRESVGPIA